MRTKSVSFPDPAKLRSLFGPCYAYALCTEATLETVMPLKVLTVVDNELSKAVLKLPRLQKSSLKVP